MDKLLNDGSKAYDKFIGDSSESAMRWWDAFKRPALLWAGGIGLALVLAGIAVLDHYEASHSLSHKLFGLFLSELGFAFWIAIILFITLEEQAAVEHGKNILSYLYGINPGHKYFRKIEEYIITKPYFRRNTVVTYNFKERDGESIFVEYTIEYIVRNVSREAREFKIAGSIDKRPIQPSSAKWDKLLGVVHIERGKEVISKAQLTIRQEPKKSRCEFYETDSIQLEPKQEIRVKAVHCLVKHDHDSEVWQGSIPSAGVEVRLDWHEELDLEFATEAIHPEPDKMKREEPTRTSIRLELDEPFMAHHGIHFSWAPAVHQATPVSENLGAPSAE